MSAVRSWFIRELASNEVLVQGLIQSGRFGLFTPNWNTTKIQQGFCHHFPKWCNSGITLTADDYLQPDNTERIAQVVAAHFPAGTSVKDMLHWK